MPGQPTPQDLHVNGLLTNTIIGYGNPAYIADRILPVVGVQKQSDIVPKLNQSFWFRNDALIRAPGTKSEGGGWTVDTTDTYFCNRYSRRVELPDQLRANADAPWNVDADAARFAMDKILMKREVQFATDHFATSKWGTDKTGGTDFTQWDNLGASNPILDIDTFKDTVEALVGVTPNKLAVNSDVQLQAKNHPAFIDRIKYTQRAQVTADLIASLLELDEYLVGRSIYTTSAEGTAEGSVTYSRIWGKHALLLYVPPSASLIEPAAGYTYVWQVVPNALAYIKRMRDEEREVDIIEANTYFAQKRTVDNAGLFMSSVVS